MSKVKAFFKRKDIEVSLKRYGIDALGAMAQGLFCTLLVGTILDTLGTQLGISFLAQPLIKIGETGYTIGKFASAMVGPAMAVAIGYALHAPAMVLFSLIPVGYATNVMGGAGGPLAVYVVAIVAAEFGKMVSKETKIDILVTPIVTILIGIGAAYFIAAPIGKGAMAVGTLIKWATTQQPFVMGMLVSVIVGIALTLPISSAAICAALSLTGLAGGAALAGCCANMVGFAVVSFRENGWGGVVSQGLGTSMLQMGNIVRNPKIWIPAIAATSSACTPAALTIKRVSYCLSCVYTTKSSSARFSILRTFWQRPSSTPFCIAFSIKAMATSNGSTITVVFASSAPNALSLICGSLLWSCSKSKCSTFSTPLILALSISSSTFFKS